MPVRPDETYNERLRERYAPDGQCLACGGSGRTPEGGPCLCLFVQPEQRAALAREVQRMTKQRGGEDV